MFGIGIPELIVIFVIALLIFGPKKLPELGKALGRGIAEFKKASQEIKESIEMDARKEDLKKYLDPSLYEKEPPSPQSSPPMGEGGEGGEEKKTEEKKKSESTSSGEAHAG